MIIAVSTAATGLFPANDGTIIHWSAVLPGFVARHVVLVLIAWHMWHEKRLVALWSALCALVGLVGAGLMLGQALHFGLGERLALYPLPMWMAVTGMAVLMGWHAARYSAMSSSRCALSTRTPPPHGREGPRLRHLGARSNGSHEPVAWTRPRHARSRSACVENAFVEVFRHDFSTQVFDAICLPNPRVRVGVGNDRFSTELDGADRDCVRWCRLRKLHTTPPTPTGIRTRGP